MNQIWICLCLKEMIFLAKQRSFSCKNLQITGLWNCVYKVVSKTHYWPGVLQFSIVTLYCTHLTYLYNYDFWQHLKQVTLAVHFCAYLLRIRTYCVYCSVFPRKCVQMSPLIHGFGSMSISRPCWRISHTWPEVFWGRERLCTTSLCLRRPVKAFWQAVMVFATPEVCAIRLAGLLRCR